MARDAGSDRELAEMAQEEVKALEASIAELENQLKVRNGKRMLVGRGAGEATEGEEWEAHVSW